MFEKLLQRILKDVIGEFTQQIDTNNLSVGIWSGQIQINKVKLNKNLFKKLSLPINVIFSFISQLKIKIPWKSFFSSPLIISIDSAFALCELDSINFSLQQKRNAFINSLKLIIANIGKRVIEKAKAQEDKQSGYFDTIMLKMFDNLYLNIKNVHFRFQNMQKKFSFGLLLDSVDIHAVDKNNKEVFIDRNKLQDEQKFIRRKFSLSKLRMYWEPNQSFFVSLREQKDKYQFFTDPKRIEEESNQTLIHIFYIDLEGFIIEKTIESILCYDVQVNQEKIELNFKKEIIEQFLFLIKKIQQLMNQAFPTKPLNQCFEQSRSFLRKFCLQFITDKDGKIKQKLKDDKLKSLIISSHNQIDNLMQLDHKQLVRIMQKIILNDIQKDKIFKFLDIKTFDVQKSYYQNQTKQQTTNKIHINCTVKLPKLMIYLFNSENKVLMELSLVNSDLTYSIRQSLSHFLWTVNFIEISGPQTCQIFWIKKNIRNSLQLELIRNDKRLQVSLFLQKINVIYDPIVINSIKSFFRLKALDSKLKNQALDKLDRIQDNVANKISNLQSQINIKIQLCGFRVTFIQKKHQLLFRTGLIIFEHQNKNQSYELYVNLIQISLISGNFSNQQQISIVQQSSFRLNYEKNTNFIESSMSELNISIDKQIFRFGKQFSKIFSGQQKSEMIKKSDIVGEIFVKQNRWKKTLSVLCEGKIYLWNQNQQYPKLKMRVRKAKKNMKGKFTYLMISDKKDFIQIAFKTEKQLSSWQKQLQKLVQFERNSQRKSESASTALQKNSKKQYSEIQINFFIPKIEILIKLNFTETILLKIQRFLYKNYLQKATLSTKNQNQDLFCVSVENVQMYFKENKILTYVKNIENEKFFSLIVKHFSQQKNTLLSRVIQLGSFELKFDPVFVIKLNQFFSSQVQGGASLYVMKSDQTLDTQDQNKILSRTLLRVKKSQVLFNNKKSKLDSISLKFQQLQIDIQTKYYEFILRGIAKNLIISDLTGYPKTRFASQQNQQLSYETKNILCSGDQKNKIIFQYIQLSKGSSKYDTNKRQLLRLTFDYFRLNYIQQVVFRIIDYLFVQLIGSITTPQFFQQYSVDNNEDNVKRNELNFKKFVKNKEDLIKSKTLSKIDKSKLEQYLFKGQRFYLQLFLNNFILNIASDNISEGLHLQASKVSIQNDFKYTQKISQQFCYSLLTQLYNVQASQISVCTVQKGKKIVSSQEPFNLKILIEMFNKDQQYNHLYGENKIFNSFLQLNADIELCKLVFSTQNLVTLQKISLYNLFHDDGLQFLMIYDYMDLMPEMQIFAKISSDLFTLEIIHENQKIVTDGGNLALIIQNTHKVTKFQVQCQFIVIGYQSKSFYEEVLTSRKNFGKLESLKTSFRSCINSADFQKQNKQSIFFIRLTRNNEDKTEDLYISIEEVMLIFNKNIFLLLKKISSKKQTLISIDPVFKSSKPIQTINMIPFAKSTKIIANRIMVCCKLPCSNGIILVLLFTCNYKQNFESKQCNFSHLQGFISNENQISAENFESIKKRTILRPTQIKYVENNQGIDVFTDRVFFKFSVNDIQSLVNLYNDLNGNLQESIAQQERTTRKKSQKSVSNQSSKSAYKSLGQILQSNEETQKSKKFTFSTVEIMIINDFQENLIPLIYTNLNIQYQNIVHSLKLQFKVDFFNIRNSYWQPLIQETKISVKISPLINIQIEPYIDLSQQIALRENKKQQKQYLNINISTNFIENFYKTLTQKNITFANLYDTDNEIGIDQINSWVIINHTGDRIICSSEDFQKEICIEQNQSAKIPFLSNIQESFNPKSNLEDKQLDVFVNILIGQKIHVRKHNINQLGLKKLFFTYQRKKYALLKNLVVDISKNVRYLTLSSVVQLENSTDIALRFFVPSESTSLMVQPKSIKFIPFNLVAEQIELHNIFQIPSNQRIMHHSEILFNKDKIDQEGKKRTLLQIQNQNVVHFNSMSLKVSTRSQKMKKIISFEPLFLIKNYLPKQLTLVLIDKQKKSLLSQYFVSGINQLGNSLNCGVNSVYYQINHAEVSLFIQGYQWTDFFQFTNNKYIMLKDYLERTIQIKVYQVKEGLKTSQFMFYYPLLIKNKTLSEISVRYPQKKMKQIISLRKDQSQILRSRDIILQIGDGLSQQLYLKNHAQFFIFRQNMNNLKAFSKYYVVKNHQKIHQDLTITQFKIYNKYLITNSTKCDIIIRPYPAKIGEIQIVQRNQTTDLIFFQIDSRMSVGSMFQFCPKQSQFDWSYPLNLLSIKESTFFIRSKNLFTKMEHFVLQVRKRIEGCIEIIFKDISNQNAIPYLLINQCDNKEIFVKNILERVDPGKQVFFNWENPFENSSFIFLEINEIKSDMKTSKTYILDMNTKQTSLTIESKNFKQNVEVQIIIEPSRKRIVFKDEQIKASNQNEKQIEQIKKLTIDLPIRLSLVNNSITPAIHVLDLSVGLKVQQSIRDDEVGMVKIQFKPIQIDNQANSNPFYPVILSSEMSLTYEKGKNQSLFIEAKQINLKIQEELFKSISSLKKFFQNLLKYEAISSEKDLQSSGKSSNSNMERSKLFISKLYLPRIRVNLQVQTKNFSLETTINLQKPQVCSFPWKQFPYPIKRIVLNILTHLSISPWAFVSSFKKGVQILLTEQSTGRAFQGFFGTILGAISNSLGGILGFIVGYDVERVDNLIDGIDQGVAIFFRQLKEIPQFETSSCNLGHILEGTGKTLFNIVFKPIKGILRMTLKITQGIKKTAIFSFDEQTFVKTRHPIVFYNRQQYFLAYDKQQSRNLYLFKMITNNRFEFFYLVKFWLIPLFYDKIDLLLAMGTQYIVLLDITRNKVRWIIQISKIIKMEILEICKLKIITVEDNKDDKIFQNLQSSNVIQKRIEKKKSVQRYRIVEEVKQVEYEIFLNNQIQAIQVVQSYVKVKSLLKFNFD